jgi:two-component system sensor histidine kinase KdpD
MPGLRHEPPPSWLGILTAAGLVALTTAVIFPLEDLAPAASLGVVYLLAVLVVSTYWQPWLGLATALASAAAFNFFHLPPTGRFTVADSHNVVALVSLLTVAVAASSVAQVARRRAHEADLRREEADLAAETARLLLGEGLLSDGLAVVGQRLGVALGLRSVAIDVEDAGPTADSRHERLPLGGDAWLVVPADLPPAVRARLGGRIAPALAPVVAAALERARLQGEVVETAALRQSDGAKTAVLRAVSHDLRSPLTAIVTAGEALRSPALQEGEREELAAVVVEEGTRLSRLIEKLLDLSRLQAGAGRPRTGLISLEEVLRAAADDVEGSGADIALSIGELPPLRADAAQLERAFANLLENAIRHGGPQPISVRARALHNRVVVRVVDRGPGIPRAEQDRIFEPFHRAQGASAGGAGLGLAIVRGLVEANGGTVTVESLPGQGATFVVELPLEPVAGTVLAGADADPSGRGTAA